MGTYLHIQIYLYIYIYIRLQYFLMFGGWRVAFRFLLLLLPFFGHAWKMFEYMLEMFIIFHCVIGISRNEMFCARNGSLNNQVSLVREYNVRH